MGGSQGEGGEGGAESGGAGGGGGGGGGEDRLDKCGPAGGGHALSHCLVTQTLIYVQEQHGKKLMEKYTFLVPSICRQNIFPLI